MKFITVHITPNIEAKLKDHGTAIDYIGMLRSDLYNYCLQHADKPLTDEIRIGLNFVVVAFLRRHQILTYEEMIGYQFDVFVEADESSERTLTTPELQNKQNAALEAFRPDDIEKARKVLADICSTKGRYFRMSIPVDADDSDMVLKRVIDRAEQSLSPPAIETGAVANLIKAGNDMYDLFYAGDNDEKTSAWRNALETIRSCEGGNELLWNGIKVEVREFPPHKDFAEIWHDGKYIGRIAAPTHGEKDKP